DRDVEGVEVGLLQIRGDPLERLLGGQSLEREVLLAHLPLEEVFPLSGRILAASPCEPLPDLVPRARGRDELEPILRRSLSLRLGGEDVDGVPRAELVVERDELAVDLRADRPMPDLGMDRVGEI